MTERDKKQQVSQRLGANPARPDAAPMPAGGDGNRARHWSKDGGGTWCGTRGKRPVFATIKYQTTCRACRASLRAYGLWTPVYDALADAFATRNALATRTTAVQPADSAADATAPQCAGLLKTEDDPAVAPQERETP